MKICDVMRNDIIRSVAVSNYFSLDDANIKMSM